jgi:serine/threonine-protein kinase
MLQLAINTVVAGRFRLNNLIGRGGMGSVWHATHLGLDIPCAVKFIEGEMAQVPEAQTRFEREAKAAAQLRSPNVVQILDHGICEGTPYIAMELLDGEDLGKRLNRSVRLSPQELHPIVNQVCRALTKAHALGIVHRDLKPDNIFLVRDDDREIAKVLDFGIAKSHSQQLGVSDTTKTGAMLGTPYYMSPEQAQGTKQVDGRSDLWALAVICFRALTGKLPFTSEALGDLLMKIIIGPIPMPSQYGAVPEGFDRWWTKATAREPAERFQSAKDFADSLALVCGVSQVSGIIDRPHVRVVAHQTSSGLPQGAAGLPQGAAAAPAAAPAAANIPAGSIPDPSLPPTYGQPHHLGDTRQPAAQQTSPNPPFAPAPTPGGAPAPPAGWGQPPPHVTPPQPFGASVTPATFGESVAGVPPKKTNVGILVGVGAAILVTLVAGVVLVVVQVQRSHAAGAGRPEGTASALASTVSAPRPPPSAEPAPSETVAVAPPASEAPTAPPTPTATATATAIAPDPMPPPTSGAADNTPPPKQVVPSDTATAKPPPHATAHATATAPAGGHTSNPPVKKPPKHEDLGI